MQWRKRCWVPIFHSSARMKITGNNTGGGYVVEVSGVNIRVMVMVLARASGGIYVGFDFGLETMRHVVGSLPPQGLYSSNIHAIIIAVAV